MNRREFINKTAAATALAIAQGRSVPLSAASPHATAWDPGAVAHLLPTVNHDRLLLKASFTRALRDSPQLQIGTRRVRGAASDTGGYFWSFDVDGLDPSTPYELGLMDQSKPLCDPWPLKTFPAPEDRPSKLRLLIYTCAGGHEGLKDKEGLSYFLPLSQRTRLLQRGLSFGPDALIAIGDHLYWDQLAGRSAQIIGASQQAKALAGVFNRSQPVLGTANEDVLKKAVGPQIADFYGTLCRSVPVFFVSDDHDYFENDHADEKIVAFPPDDFMVRLGRASHRLYYPEYLPDLNRPSGLAGSSAMDRPAGVSESFGTLRYGRLAELLLYDCRRFLSLKGPSAVFVPTEVERWLLDRMKASETDHVANVPSTPVAWTAGKWGEWYPDALDEKGRLGVRQDKYLWQPGWRAQHDRLLRAASAMKNRLPLFISGDLHCLGEGRIHRSGGLDLSANPVISILSGPVGATGPHGWPSAFRGTPARVPHDLEVEEGLPPMEENGFILVDFTADKAVFRFFKYNRHDPAENIDRLEPFRVVEMERPA